MIDLFDLLEGLRFKLGVSSAQLSTAKILHNYLMSNEYTIQDITNNYNSSKEALASSILSSGQLYENFDRLKHLEFSASTLHDVNDLLFGIMRAANDWKRLPGILVQDANGAATTESLGNILARSPGTIKGKSSRPPVFPGL